MSVEIIDNAIVKVDSIFHQLVLGVSYLKLGHNSLTHKSDNLSVVVTVGKDTTTEPIRLANLRHLEPNVEQGLMELCQTKLIALWSDILQDLFSAIIKNHFSGTKTNGFLRVDKFTLDISDITQLPEKICSQICCNFGFSPYKDRINYLNKLQQSSALAIAELAIIRRHVEIRNSIEHHSSRFPHGSMDRLGCQSFQMLDAEGDEFAITDGQSIRLSIPEIDTLKRALMRVLNSWRALYA